MVGLRGWGAGWASVSPLSVAKSAPLSSTASNVLFFLFLFFSFFPDVTPITKLKSHDFWPYKGEE